MTTINANGVTMNYRLEGPDDGPVVMLSNSLMSDLTMWDGQVPALARRYRVLRYDTRGHGATEASPPPYSIELLVDDARALLDALNIGSVHFVGLSLGGMIGQLFAVRYPTLLKSLVLCDTSSHMPPEALWDDRIRTAKDNGLESMAPATIERWFTAPFRERNAVEIERHRAHDPKDRSRGLRWLLPGHPGDEPDRHSVGDHDAHPDRRRRRRPFDPGGGVGDHPSRHGGLGTRHLG